MRAKRIELPQHHFTIEPSDDWLVDEGESAEQRETLGIYLRSVAHGVYFNVRAQSVGDRLLARGELQKVLREQRWASPPFDEWSETSGSLCIVGGTFEMTKLSDGEVVLEVFVTDGRHIANLAGPGDRVVIRAVTPEVRSLAKAISFA